MVLSFCDRLKYLQLQCCTLFFFFGKLNFFKKENLLEPLDSTTRFLYVHTFFLCRTSQSFFGNLFDKACHLPPYFVQIHSPASLSLVNQSFFNSCYFPSFNLHRFLSRNHLHAYQSSSLQEHPKSLIYIVIMTRTCNPVVATIITFNCAAGYCRH